MKLQVLSKPSGFTLVEMAMVMIIVGLLLGGLLIPFSMQLDQQSYSHTQKQLDEIKESLIGYALVNERLPCPDTDGDALENTSVAFVNDTPTAGQSTETTSCTLEEGWLPSQNLQISDRDYWSKRLRYRVAQAFASSSTVYNANGGAAGGGSILSTAHFSLATTGDISVQNRGDDPGTAGVQSKFLQAIVTNVPAVVISHGKNGYGSSSSQSVAILNPPAENVDETTNSNSGTTKVSRSLVRDQGNCSDTDEALAICEFDDLVIWLPTSLLMGRMVSAGKLP